MPSILTTPMTPIEHQISDWKRRLESQWPGLDLERLVKAPTTLNNLERDTFRGLALGSLHFTCVFLLGYDKMSLLDGTHGEMCAQLEAINRPQMHLKYRGFFKSTIGTISHPIWNFMHDPEQYSFVLITDDEPLGRSRMRDVKKALRRPQVEVLFPECVINPDEKADNMFSLLSRTGDGPSGENRTSRMPQAGRHPMHLIYDDLVNEMNYNSRDYQERLRKYLDESQPTIEATNLVTYVATLWANYDATHHFVSVMYPHNLDLYVTPVRGHADIEDTGRIVVHDGHEYAYPVCPDCQHEHQWDDEKFERVKAGYRKHPFIFRAQFMLDTSQAEGESFEEEWLQWRQRPDTRYFSRYMSVDPASGERGADNSRPAIAVIGYGHTGEIQVMETRDHYNSITDCLDDMFALYDIYKPEKVGVESYAGVGNTFLSLARRQMQERGVYFEIVKQTHPRETKDQHIIEALQYPYQARVIWHDHDLRGGRYEEQLLTFPGGEYKDLLDAVAYAVKLALEFGYRGPLPGTAEKDDGAKVVPNMGDRITDRINSHRGGVVQKETSGGFW